MGKFKKMLAVVLAGSVMLGMAGCSKGNKIKALTKKEYKKILKDELDIDNGDIYILDGLGRNRKGKEIEGELIQTRYESCMIFIELYDDEDIAADYFDGLIEYAEAFEEDEKRSEAFEHFDGEMVYSKEENAGYIIVTCDGGPVPGFFGDANQNKKDFYGAAYYSDNVVVRIVPEAGIYEDGDSKHIIEIIEALGYPTMEDVGDTK
ncbi:MAG: hypothetical protein MJ108_09995 [Saccharofermentans sp.]|nr:hypothetical protein [Saccharofermentans sp.]